MIDAEFAKGQLILLTREWYMHANGQLPAYEWNFGDVNPPVHAWATIFTYRLEKAQKAEERARAKAAEAEKAEEKATAKAAEAERQRKNAVAALAKANSETARARAAEQRTDAEKEAALSLLAKLTDSMYSAFKDNESIRAPWSGMLDETIAYADQRKLFNSGEAKLRARLVIAIANAADLAQKLGKEDVARSKLEKAVAEARKLQQENLTDFGTQRSVASGFALASITYRVLKDGDRAREALAHGMAVIEQSTPANDEERAQQLKIWGLFFQVIGTLETDAKNPERIRQAYATAVAKAEEAVKVAPDKSDLLPDLRRHLFDSYLLFAAALLNQDALEEARQYYHKARTTSVNVSNESVALWKSSATRTRRRNATPTRSTPTAGRSGRARPSCSMPAGPGYFPPTTIETPSRK